jgi:hypothetical protein
MYEDATWKRDVTSTGENAAVGGSPDIVTNNQVER